VVIAHSSRHRRLHGQVLNNRPFTDTVLPVARELKPGKSSKFISDSVTTLTVVIGGVAPVEGGVCHNALVDGRRDRPVTLFNGLK